MRRPGSEAGPLLDWEASRLVSAGIRELREAKGLAQADIADAAGVSQTMACKLEKARHRWRARDAEKAAELLGTTLEALLGGES